MQTRLAIILALVLTTPALARAATGTCTVTRFIINVPSQGDELQFGVPVANGVAMPIEFDEASGAFSMSRDAWATRFGTPYCSFTNTQACSALNADAECRPPACPNCNDPAGDQAEVCAIGASFLTVGTVHGFIVMPPGTSTGSIDASGHVTLPRFQETFLTDFEKPLTPLSHELTVATGMRQTPLGQAVYVSEGAALNFQTGELTLSGAGVLQGAPGAGTTVTGFKLTCTLAPIPDAASLPRAPTIVATGKAKTGDAAKGDTLTLKVKLVPGAAGLPRATEDLLLRLAPKATPGCGPDDKCVVILVPAGKLTAKGKKLSAVEPVGDPASDGTSIRAFRGHKKDAAVGGKLTLVGGKKAGTLTLKLGGLDLSAFMGAAAAEATVTVTSGPQNATDAVTATKGKIR